jgi:hypothetical protein
MIQGRHTLDKTPIDSRRNKMFVKTHLMSTNKINKGSIQQSSTNELKTIEHKR